MAKYNENVLVRQGSALQGFGTRMLSNSVMLIDDELYDRKTLKKIPYCARPKNSNYRLSYASWDGFFPWCSYNSGIFVNNTGSRFGANAGNYYTQIDETNHWLERDARFENYWYNENDGRFVYLGGTGKPAHDDDNPSTLIDYFNKNTVTIEHSKSTASSSYGSVMYPIGDIGDDVIFVPIPSTAANGWYGYPTKYNKSTTTGATMRIDFSSYYTWLIDVDYDNSEALYLVRSQNTGDTSIWKWNFETDTYLKSTHTTASGYSFPYPESLSFTANGTVHNNYSLLYNFDKHQPSTIFFDYDTGYYGYYQFLIWDWNRDYRIIPYKVLFDPGATGVAPTLIGIHEIILHEPLKYQDIKNNMSYSENVYRNGTIPRIIDNGTKLQVIYYGYLDKNACIKTYNIVGGELTFNTISYLHGQHLFTGQDNALYHGQLQSVKFLDNENYDEIIVNYAGDVGDWDLFHNDTTYVNQGGHMCMLYRRDENYHWYEAWSELRPYSASFIDKENGRVVGMCKNHAADYVDGAIIYNHAKYYVESFVDLKVHMLYQFNESDFVYDGIDKDVTIKVASHVNRNRLNKSFKLNIIGSTATVFKDTNSKEMNVTTKDTFYVDVIITLKDNKDFEIKEYII